MNAINVNFLDINLDLQQNTYRPYMKPNETSIYVHRESNHPRRILENIPKSVNTRLSKISSSKEVFDSAIPLYQEALYKSGYDFKLSYDENIPTETKKQKRNRKITWFNPPFSKNVETKIGAKFLKLIDQTIPKNHILRKIINRNTVKISYRCMPNLKKKIANHNFKILKAEDENRTQMGCNCTRAIGSCPLEGNCLVNNVIYRAEVKDDSGNTNTYTGLASTSFKKRFYGHRQSFKKRKLQHSTTLSSHIWDLKDNNQNYEIKWSALDRAPIFNPINKKCRLCTKEKYYIIFQPDGAKLNNRSELFSTCRHRKNQLLSNI